MTPAAAHPAGAEARMREARDQLVNVLEAATQFSIIAMDTGGRDHAVNEGASRMLGHDPADMLGRCATALIDPEELAARAREIGLEPGFEALVAAARAGEADVQDWTYIRCTGGGSGAASGSGSPGSRRSSTGGGCGSSGVATAAGAAADRARATREETPALGPTGRVSGCR